MDKDRIEKDKILDKRHELNMEFLETLKSLNLIRTNRVDESFNNTQAGTSTDLISETLMSLNNEGVTKLIEFMRSNPDKTRKILIDSGGFKGADENIESFEFDTNQPDGSLNTHVQDLIDLIGNDKILDKIGKKTTLKKLRDLRKSQ